MGSKFIYMLNILYFILYKVRFFHVLILFQKKSFLLMYHGVTSDEYCGRLHELNSSFENQLRVLNKHYSNCDLYQLLKRHFSGQGTNGLFSITFDDGYENNLIHALPLLKKYKLTASIFISAEYIDTDKSIWSCQVDEFYSSEIACSVKMRLKKLTGKELLKKVEKYLSSPSKKYRLLSSKQIQCLLKNGITIFSHSKRHLIMNNLSNSLLEEEISEAKKKIEKLKGMQDKIFVYPNGDYNIDVINMLMAYDYEYAITTERGFLQDSKTPYEIKRLAIPYNWEREYQILAITTGVHHKIIGFAKYILRYIPWRN